ncbi:hypothetical protein EVAR_66236_1 [Eumeta japonica]|uniref:Uncharacterized protein n=1 Tax=Eumeta variegata TaxID=151549 RepID=A0A4C1ZU21_EUMVA|nr:hypothetical protein EVAR_66236_1 [Eumeta japonica]
MPYARIAWIVNSAKLKSAFRGRRPGRGRLGSQSKARLGLNFVVKSELEFKVGRGTRSRVRLRIESRARPKLKSKVEPGSKSSGGPVLLLVTEKQSQWLGMGTRSPAKSAVCLRYLFPLKNRSDISARDCQNLLMDSNYSTLY